MAAEHLPITKHRHHAEDAIKSRNSHSANGRLHVRTRQRQKVHYPSKWISIIKMKDAHDSCTVPLTARLIEFIIPGDQKQGSRPRLFDGRRSPQSTQTVKNKNIVCRSNSSGTRPDISR